MSASVLASGYRAPSEAEVPVGLRKVNVDKKYGIFSFQWLHCTGCNGFMSENWFYMSGKEKSCCLKQILMTCMWGSLPVWPVCGKSGLCHFTVPSVFLHLQLILLQIFHIQPATETLEFADLLVFCSSLLLWCKVTVIWFPVIQKWYTAEWLRGINTFSTSSSYCSVWSII